MKTILSLTLALASFTASALEFKTTSFLNPGVFGPYQVTNAACANCYTQALYGGITVSNAAAAPLGSLTNLSSWNNSTTAPINQGTNGPRLTWTNHNGTWVIPTNGTPGTLAGVSFSQGPDRTPLLQDIDLPLLGTGNTPLIITTNNFAGDGTAYALSPFSLNVRLFGDSGAATGLNMIFVGLPDGTNEVPDVAGPFPKFVWGVVPIVGTTVCTTNFPIWKFAGCKKIRLRSATLTTTTAASIGVTIQALNFNGPQP
jgi:hypothetical protein